MNISFPATVSKEAVFASIEKYLNETDLSVDKKDDTRPWGGFFEISEREQEKFIQLYFPHLSAGELSIAGKLSPKLLIIAPGKRLSWQYHHRRAEIWRLIGGTAGVVTSDTDEEKETAHLRIGDIVQLKRGERHRLIGLDDWGVIAEIWRHTDETNPSDEEDIVRVSDDFGR